MTHVVSQNSSRFFCILVRIYYKKGNHKYFSDIATHYEVVKLKNGYDRAQSYYRPEYNIANEAIFKWTEIDWKSMVITNSNGEAIIKIPVNDFSKPYQLIINGFSDQGLLLYELYKTE